jgi:ATP-binding cassette subfamily B (MDR/TAP) protein 1
MVFGGFFMSSFQWAQGKVDDAYAESNALLSDIIMNYRTVISLGEKNVEFMLEKYYGLLEGPNLQGIKKAHISGILYGYSQSVRFIFVALSFYFAILILENSENPDGDRRNVFTAVYIMFVGAIGSGVAVSQMPSLSRAKAAARKIFTIIKEESQADPRESLATGGGTHEIKKGYIKLQDVSFKYKSRNKYVLQNFNLDIRDNESVALVGHSGSGKSTIASLLLRFYDKQKGRLLIDDIDIESYPVKHIRDQIAIVMQEPLLFNESILENIKYGCPDASNAQVIKAATQANCLDFIQSS